MTRLLQRIAGLNEEDLSRQTGMIRSTFAILNQQGRPAPPLRLRLTSGIGASADPIQLASWIGERLSETAILELDRASWVTFTQTTSSHVASTPAGVDLYGGLPGIALFLGSLGAVTQNARFTDLARSAALELLAAPALQEQFQTVGAFDGLGGVIYALVHLAKFLPELGCIARAEQLAKLFGEPVNATVEIDVISGLAGLILSSLAAGRQTSQAIFSDLAIKAGQVLLGQLSDPRRPHRRDPGRS